MLSMATIYHREIGFPASIQTPAPGAVLTYSKHALRAAHDDHLRAHDLPPRLPEVFELVEVTTFAGRVVRWVVRFPYLRNVDGRPEKTGWDVVLVVSFDYAVLTLFINRETDQHGTLRRERYSEVG